MINFDILIVLADGYSEWNNATVDNWDQFVGYIGNGATIRNVRRLSDI